jgi:hydroxyacylglutathione hydrolase
MRIEVFTSGILKTNTYVVGPDTSDEVIVIDPAGKIRLVLDFVAAGGLKIVGIVNTHRHWDHISGNAAVKRASGAPIMIHEDDAQAISKTNVFSMLLRASASWSPPADVLLKEGSRITVGSYVFEVIHTPGHSPGGICLRYKKFLFTGDTLMAGTVGRTDIKHGSWQKLSESIKDKLFILSDDIACYPGHGPKTTIERERRSNMFVRYTPEQIEEWLFQSLKAEREHRRRAEAGENEAHR